MFKRLRALFGRAFTPPPASLLAPHSYWRSLLLYLPDFLKNPTGIGLFDSYYPTITPIYQIRRTDPVDPMIKNYRGHLEHAYRQMEYPRPEFDRYVTSLVRWLAAYFHHLPASEANHHNQVASAFFHALHAANTAVRLYSSAHSMELEIATEHRTAYREASKLAVFYGALFHDVGKPVADFIVVPTDRHGRRVSGDIWLPADETLVDWAVRTNVDYYRCIWRPDRQPADHRAHMMRIFNRFEHVIPRHPHLDTLVRDLLADIIHNPTSNLGAIVKLADRESSVLDMRRFGRLPIPLDPVIQFLQAVQDFANYYYQRPTHELLLVHSSLGVLITYPKGFDAILQFMPDQSGAGRPFFRTLPAGDQSAHMLQMLFEHGFVTARQMPNGQFVTRSQVSVETPTGVSQVSAVLMRRMEFVALPSMPVVHAEFVSPSPPDASHHSIRSGSAPPEPAPQPLIEEQDDLVVANPQPAAAPSVPAIEPHRTTQLSPRRADRKGGQDRASEPESAVDQSADDEPMVVVASVPPPPPGVEPRFAAPPAPAPAAAGEPSQSADKPRKARKPKTPQPQPESTQPAPDQATPAQAALPVAPVPHAADHRPAERITYEKQIVEFENREILCSDNAYLLYQHLTSVLPTQTANLLIRPFAALLYQIEHRQVSLEPPHATNVSLHTAGIRLSMQYLHLLCKVVGMPPARVHTALSRVTSMLSASEYPFLDVQGENTPSVYLRPDFCRALFASRPSELAALLTRCRISWPPPQSSAG